MKIIMAVLLILRVGVGFCADDTVVQEDGARQTTTTTTTTTTNPNEQTKEQSACDRTTAIALSLAAAGAGAGVAGITMDLGQEIKYQNVTVDCGRVIEYPFDLYNFDQDHLDVGVVNGENATPGEFPFFAAPLRRKQLWGGCGGTLVHDRFVLTAAHCLRPIMKSVFVGAYHRKKSGNGGQVSIKIPIKKMHKHWNYTAGSSSWDVGLIELDSPVSTVIGETNIDTLGNLEAIPPVLLDTGDIINHLCIQDNLTVCGFGKTESGRGSEVLKKADVQFIPSEICKKYYGSFVRDEVICARGEKKGPCFGDSGGPLLMRYANQYIQLGIVTGGRGCASDFPVIYAKIARAITWIREIVCKFPRKEDSGKICTTEID